MIRSGCFEAAPHRFLRPFFFYFSLSFYCYFYFYFFYSSFSLFFFPRMMTIMMMIMIIYDDICVLKEVFEKKESLEVWDVLFSSQGWLGIPNPSRISAAAAVNAV